MFVEILRALILAFGAATLFYAVETAPTVAQVTAADRRAR
jgi:hypothetical protein